ncbi:tyrosine-type recombinase/integrase [Corynebacterium vitaeruminis]|uniref:tyrosine-type recombinase/integrase n=1 Tax=Corynebacterium vitaeruminis TaxID=38305 RepID=UPI0023F5060C|nr:site-specific integrase [Corynebacterium vitaeruminis]
MASIKPYDTKSGRRWRVDYVKPDGKNTSKRGFIRKGDAQAWAEHNAVSVRSGEWVAERDKHRRLDSFWDAWWASKQILEPGSTTVMERSWRIYVKPRWGDYAVGSIRKSEVQAWLAEHKEKASSISRAFGVLAGLLDQAVEEQCLPRNPVRGVVLPRRPQPKHVYLSMDQVSQLVEECSQQKMLVLLLATTGLRWGEAVGLQKRDLMAGKDRIRVERAVKDVGHVLSIGGLKTHETRVVAAPHSVMVALRRQARGLEPGGLLFTKPGGGMWGNLGKNDFFNMAVKRMVDDGRLPERITAHGLRHVAAGLLVSAGANVKVVQRQLGHKSAAMTLDTYADLFDGDLDEVASVMDGVLSSSVKFTSRGDFLRVVDEKTA